MLIPYNTDAPIYHFPYATIGLIVTNVLAYVATILALASGVDEGESAFVVQESYQVIDWFLLQYDVINPLQWITSNFMHADPLHLLGNMIFLWGFGLIIEGKLGWLRFIGLYLLIGAITCACEQLLFFLLVGEGASLGASAIIFGLMAVAMVWAPKNELTCLFFIRFIPRTIELPIVTYAAIQFGFEILYFGLAGFQVSSALLHLFGVVVGLPLGYLFVHQKWVDCEGWDAMTVYFSSVEKQEKVRNEFRDRNKVAELKEAKQQRDEDQQRIIQSLTSALQAKQYAAATAIYNKFETELQGGQKLPSKLLGPIVAAFHNQKKWEASVPLMVLMLKKKLPPEKATKIRLTLAQVLIKVTDQPKQGIAVLRKLPQQLSEKDNKMRSKLANLAKRALEDGSLEVEIYDW